MKQLAKLKNVLKLFCYSNFFFCLFRDVRNFLKIHDNSRETIAYSKENFQFSNFFQDWKAFARLNPYLQQLQFELRERKKNSTTTSLFSIITFIQVGTDYIIYVIIGNEREKKRRFFAISTLFRDSLEPWKLKTISFLIHVNPPSNYCNAFKLTNICNFSKNFKTFH